MTDNEITGSLGVLLSLAIVGVMGVLAVLGARRGGRSGTPARAVALGFAVYAAVFLLFLHSYRSWVADPTAPLIAGLPAPTLWLLLGIFQLPWLLVFVLMAKFQQWTLGPDDIRAFQALLASRDRQAASEPKTVAQRDASGGPDHVGGS